MLEIKRLFFIFNDTQQKNIKSQVNKLAFFLVAHCLIFSHNQPFRLGGGGMHVHPVHPPCRTPPCPASGEGGSKPYVMEHQIRIAAPSPAPLQKV
jgi:hypothetical protein